MKFPESTLAHQLLDGLHGIEIGGAAHNSFGLNTRAAPAVLARMRNLVRRWTSARG